MSPLAWWLIPLGATLLAVVWVSWRSRPRRPAEAEDAIATRQKFKAAMERPLPSGASRRGRPATGTPLPRSVDTYDPVTGELRRPDSGHVDHSAA